MINSLSAPELKHELVNGESYEYYALGKYVVMAPGICGRRPTFKYTRLETSVVLADIAAGLTIDEILADFDLSDLSREAIQEAVELANQAFLQTTHNLFAIAA